MPPKRDNVFAEPPAKRFRSKVADLFLRNDLSGCSAQELAARATEAGARGVEDLGRAGASGRQPQNSSRDLLRRLKRGVRGLWPSLYMADIPGFDPKHDCAKTYRVAFLLPHAILGNLARRKPSVLQELRPAADRAPELAAYMDEVCRREGLSSEGFVPFGVHGDGVPWNADRTKSLEIFSCNWPALRQPGLPLRIPITAMPKDLMCKEKSFPAIYEILRWSFQCLTLGTWPSRRHDGTEWAASDKLGALAGQSLGARGMLTEIRGDWDWFHKALALPAHNSAEGICWMCRATTTTMRQTGEDACWRCEDLPHEELMQRSRDRGGDPCPLFSCLGVTAAIVLPDWLHCVDLGTGADIVGNIFWHALQRLPGGNQKTRLAELFRRMQVFYEAQQVQDCLGSLTIGMIRKGGTKAPKLRGKGCEVRSLVPFAMQLALEVFDSSDPLQQAMVAIAKELNTMYQLVRDFDAVALATSSRRLAALYVALEARSAYPLWRVKPKLHLVQELCERIAQSRGSPRLYWCYRDEDFGGKTVVTARRRGGKLTPYVVSSRLLERFMCRHALFR